MLKGGRRANEKVGKLAKAIIKEFAFFIINGKTIWSRCLLLVEHSPHSL